MAAALLIAYLILTLTAVARVVTDFRQPLRAAVWVLVLCFMPVIGLALYYFFGRNTRRGRIISRRGADQLTRRSLQEFAEQGELSLPPRHTTMIRQMTTGGEALPFAVGDTRFFTTGADFFLSLLRDIMRARSHIHLLSYIFEDDALGRLVADALTDRARAGVEVRVVYDDVGCWRVAESFFERMRRAGVDAQPFMPVRFPAFTSKVNYRNHRKLAVIDGMVGYIGGMNIARRYACGTGRGPWLDLHCRLTGNVVYGLQQAFLTDWYFVDRTLISHRKYYPATACATACATVGQVVATRPASLFPTPSSLTQGYVRAVVEARSYVYMATPYFLPTEPLLSAIEGAAAAGVDVRLVVAMRPDARLAGWAGRGYLTRVAEAGVRVYLCGEGFIHAKLLVSDDTLAVCGSANLDFRSLENNFESCLFLYGADAARRLRDIFRDYQSRSVAIEDTPLCQCRSVWKRTGEGLARLLAPLL